MVKQSVRNTRRNSSVTSTPRSKKGSGGHKKDEDGFKIPALPKDFHKRKKKD